MKRYICKTQGFTITPFHQNSLENSEVKILYGDIVEELGGYLYKGEYCICHENSILGKYHFCRMEE